MHGDDSRNDDNRSADDMARLASVVPFGNRRSVKPSESAPPPLLMREVPLTDFMLRPPPQRRFAIAKILPRRVASLLGGHGGAAKTTVTLILLAHAACGREFAGFTTDRPLRCVFVSLEDEADEVLELLRRIVNAYGLDAELVSANLRIIDGTDTDAALAVEVNDFGARQLVFTALMEQVEDAAMGADVVAIDNASDAFAGDENSRRHVRKFLRRLTQMAKHCDCAVLLLVHIDKAAARFGSSGQTYIGSVTWHNTVRSRLALVATNEGEVELRHEKSNRGPKAEPVTLRWCDGLPMPLRGADADQQRSDDVEVAMAVMHAATKAGIRVLCATTGPNTAWHAVNHLPESEPFAERATGGPKRLHRALEAAARQRRLVRAEVEVAHRKKRDAWRLSDASAALAQIDPNRDHAAPISTAGNGCANTPHTPHIGALARTHEGRAKAPMADDAAMARIGALAQADDQGDP